MPEHGHGIEVVSFSGDLGREVDDKDFAAVFPTLSRMPELHRLGLGGPDITDESLKLVGRLKTLEHVDVSYGRFTAAGLRELKDLPRLRYLYVPRTISEDELASLRQLMPDARIDYRSDR